MDGGDGVGEAYQSRPPDSGFVRRKGPNMAVVWVVEGYVSTFDYEYAA
jgi:hypothetical protein